MMEAVRTSETSLNFNVTTRRYIPEESKMDVICVYTENYTKPMNKIQLHRLLI
jgi:hypothetical protein